MSASRSVFSALFGTFNWSAPRWLKSLKQLATEKPLKFFSIMLLLAAVVGTGIYGYQYYQQLPKPLKVMAEVIAPQIGDYQDDIEQPTALVLQFHYDFAAQPKQILPAPELSAARLDLIGEVLTQGVTISPAISGKWLWQDENSLSFMPDKAWPAGQEYKVQLEKKLFAPDLELAQQQYQFATAPLTAEIEELRFYQHPTEVTTRQVVATLNFSHPVQQTSVQQQLSLLMRKDGADINQQATALSFSLSSDSTGTQWYVKSEPLTLPEHEQYLTVALKQGVNAVNGSGKTRHDSAEQLLVPDKTSFLKVTELRADIVRTPELEPEQMLLLEFTDRINRSELSSKLKLYALPKHPKRRSNYWNVGEVNPTVLSQATPLEFSLMPTPTAEDSAFSLKLDVRPGQAIFVSVPKGLVSRSSFTLANEYRTIVEAPAYPKEARVVGEGNMLTLSGEQKLQLLSRGVSGIKVRLYKLLPDQLNHLISQTNGDISKPYFNSYQFDESNISSAFEQTFALAERHPKEANYLALSLSSYLKQAGMGVFFVELSAWDPARPKAYGEQLDKRLVLVTDLGLLVKHNSDSSQQVFVMSTATGKPVAGAKVELLGKNGVPVLTGNTDAQGSVKLGKTNGFERERTPVVYKVSHSANGLSDSSFIPFDRYSRQLDYSKFNTHGRYQDEQNDKALNAYVFSDRGIYRPGEQIELAAIIRHNDLSLADGALPLRVQVSGPRGSTFWQQNFTLQGRGLHTFSIPTQPQSDTGQYHASISLLDKKGNSSRHLGSVSIAVEEFEPDTLKIANRFNQQSKGWLSPQELVAIVQLDNLFGTPAQQRRVSARFELIPSSFSFPAFPEYQFLTPKDDNVRLSRISQTLDEQQTNADGSASFTLPLQQYAAGSYRLVFSSEGFDGDGGDSVQSSRTALLSPLPTLVGVKADGELNYLKKQQQRTLQFIAVTKDLQQVALEALSLKLVEKRAQSSLVKQRDGTYQYQSIVQDVPLSESVFNIGAEGTVYKVPTADAGDFELQLFQGDMLLGKLAFSVVGAGNISAMLEQNAALSVKLDKTDYKAGDWIELNITAPYTGSGLISIESDKVHAFSWFSSNTTSSIQRIRLPEGIEGNAYINVSYVRSSDSDALFISPLSYAVVPFNIDRSKRQLDISLIVPNEVRPGKAFSVSYKTDREADLLLYGVDEGILQVADYQLPDPLTHFLQKRALQVRSMQMLDLILPEFSALQRQLAGVGGDEERLMAMASRMMDKNLNPFARRAEQPGVFWLGKVAAGTTLQSAEVTVPASFSGNLKVMAVAVSDEALSASSKDVIVRGPFVLTPEVLPSAAPGDEFDVSVTVANGVSGSGANAPVTVSLTVPAGLTVLGDSERTLSIAENGEQNLRFRLKAADEPGEQTIRFTARYQQGQLIEQASRDVSLSLRPASHYLSDISAGYAKQGPVTLVSNSNLYSALAQQSVVASNNPLVLAESFSDYLSQYPHGCTEQMVSQVFPWVGLVRQPSYQAQWPLLNEKFALLIQKLAERQQSDGGFSFWPGHYGSADFPSVYAIHFLLEAREQGLAVPDYLLEPALEYLQSMARLSGANVYQARLRANAIYLLTRSGRVTTNYLVELHERLEKQHQQAWQTDITAVYMAASYQLLQQPEVALGLVRGYRLGKASGMQNDYLARISAPMPPYANPTFQSQLSLDAQYIYLLSRHFDGDVEALDSKHILSLLQPVFDGKYNTIGTAYAILALSAYAELQPKAAADAIAFYQLDAKGARSALSPADNAAATALHRFTPAAKQIVIESDTPLFYALSEAGFSKTAADQAVSEQLEVVRDYLDQDGKVVTNAKQGDELTVRLRLRSTSKGWHNNVAVVDLLPAGFSIIRSSVPRSTSHWRADYVDVREDRLVYYASFGPNMTELNYKVKVSAAGDFIVPGVYAQSMYDNSVRAQSAAGRFAVASSQ